MPGRCREPSPFRPPSTPTPAARSFSQVVQLCLTTPPRRGLSSLSSLPPVVSGGRGCCATEIVHPLGRLLQTLALLHWEATLIQGLLQPLALLDWEATLIQGLLQPLA
jgi:hypothetical protein